MSADIDDDTAAAIVSLWQGNKALQALYPDGPKRDALPTQPGAYAQMTVGKDGARANVRAGTGAYDGAGNWLGAPWFDYRKVSLRFYGTKDQCQAALSLMTALFNQKLGAPGNTPVTLPSGARFIRWWPMDDGKVEDGKTQRGAKWIYRACIDAEFQSVRRD